MYRHVYRTHGMICGIKVVTEGAHRHAEVRAEQHVRAALFAFSMSRLDAGTGPSPVIFASKPEQNHSYDQTRLGFWLPNKTLIFDCPSQNFMHTFFLQRFSTAPLRIATS